MKRSAPTSKSCAVWAMVACTAMNTTAIHALSSAAIGVRPMRMYDVTSPSVTHAQSRQHTGHNHQRQQGTSVPSPFPWEFRSADDFDVPVMTDLLEQKCQFDRDLSGRPPITMKPATGDTLTSLFPELPTGQVLLIHEKETHNERTRSTDPNRPIVGFAMYALRYYGMDRSVPPSMWLHALFVEPHQRSNGAGKALMDEIAAISHTKRCSHVGWKCHVDNFKGQTFYDRMGASIESQKGDLVSYSWVPDAWGVKAAPVAAASY